MYNMGNPFLLMDFQPNCQIDGLFCVSFFFYKRQKRWFYLLLPDGVNTWLLPFSSAFVEAYAAHGTRVLP